MNKFLTLTATALLSSAALISPASAATFLLTYSSPNTPASGSIYITTTDMPNSVGSYDVLTAKGKIDGVDITGLIPNPNPPAQATSADGLFFYDNAFAGAATPHVTNAGLYFGVAGGQFNLFSNSPTEYALYSAANGVYGANSTGTLSVEAVPEPATWGMMLVGFGLVGFGLRSHRNQPVRVTYA